MAWASHYVFYTFEISGGKEDSVQTGMDKISLSAGPVCAASSQTGGEGKRRRYMGIIGSQFKIRINSHLTFKCTALF
jgi:hypothetical protein